MSITFRGHNASGEAEAPGGVRLTFNDVIADHPPVDAGSVIADRGAAMARVSRGAPSYSSIASALMGTLLLLLSHVAAVPADTHTWTTNGPGGGSIGAIAIDPSNPSTLYAGTGYPSFGGAFVGYGGGIFKSTDGGVTWAGVSNSLGRSFIAGLAIDPHTPATVYAATYNGIAKTVTGGAQWEWIGPPDTVITAIALDPATPTTVYATTYGAVFKSHDAGATWTASALPANLVPQALAIDPVTPDVIYVGTTGDVFSDPSVLRSVDGGLTWQSTGPIGRNLPMYVVTIDPTNPSVVYAGGLQGLFRSADRGNSWTDEGLAEPVYSIVIDPTMPSTLYLGIDAGVFKLTDHSADFANKGFDLFSSPQTFALAMDPTNPAILYAGQNSELCHGLYKTTDAAATWNPAGLTNAPIEDVAVVPGTPPTLYAAYECGGIAKSGDGGVTWRNADAGLPPGRSFTRPVVTTLAVEETNPETLYVGTDTGIYESTNGGDSWRDLGAGFGAGTLRIVPGSPNTLYASESLSGNLWKTVDGGATWVPLAMTFVADSFAIDPNHPTTLYVGVGGELLYSGAVFKSTNGGDSWTQLKQTFSLFPYIAVDPTASNTVYVACTQGYLPDMYKSADGGASWQPQPPSPASISTIAIDPATPTTLYASTSGANPRGVFRSLDGGTTWTTFNLGLGISSVSVVALDSHNIPTLYAGGEEGAVYRVQPVPVMLGKCDGSGTVTVDDLLTLVSIALGDFDPSACPYGIPAGAEVDINLLVEAVNTALAD